jgi:uncharacterized protein YcfL
MKKLLIFLFLLFAVSGCGADNTPKAEVQKLLSNYNNLSSDLLIQLDSVMESENLTDSQINKYKEVLKRQYKDLKYKINDEIISQDNAIVSTEIEVYNLIKTIDDSEDYVKENKEEFYIEEELNNDKFWNYKLDKMLKANERIKYTVDFSLTKIDNKWQLDELLEIDRQKIHGLYK